MFAKISSFFSNLFKKKKQDDKWKNLGSNHAANPSNPQPLDPANDPWRT